MDATSLITPSDTHKGVKKTHIFMIVNMVVIILALGGTIGWLVYAASNNKYPYEKYNRKTGPPGTVKISTMKLPATGASSDDNGGGSSSNATLSSTTPSSSTPSSSTPSSTTPSSTTPSSGY